MQSLMLLIAVEFAPPVGPPPDTYRPTSLPTAACQCKPCQCEECGCKPVKGERLPESPYKAGDQNRVYSSQVLTQQRKSPVITRGYCQGGQCYSRRYVPQRRSGIFGWRR